MPWSVSCIEKQHPHFAFLFDSLVVRKHPVVEFLLKFFLIFTEIHTFSGDVNQSVSFLFIYSEIAFNLELPN